MPSPSYWKSDVPNPSESLLRNVPEGRCDRSLARSAWDSATPKSRPVGYGVIRAGGRTDWMIGVTEFRIVKLKTFMLYDFWPTIQFLSMANTFSCLNIYCVFSTKERVRVLNPDIRERLWPYMGGIAKQNGIIPKCIGGVSDHVHLLVTLPTRLAIAKAAQLIKAGSSAWIDQTFPNLRNFGIQPEHYSIGLIIERKPNPLKSLVLRV